MAIESTVTGPRTKWLFATAALGLVGATALGLAVMRALSASTEAPAAHAAVTTLVVPAHETLAQAAATTAPRIASSATTAAKPSVSPDSAIALPPAATLAPNTAIPWDDLPQITSQSCKALATVGEGPRALLTAQAVMSAQRAFVRGNTAAAHEAFCTAAQLGTPNDAVLLGLARVLFIQSDLTGALEAVNQLLQRAPTNKQAFELRGDILIRMGNIDEARKAWFQAAGATRASKLLIDNLIRANDADAKTAFRSGDLPRADRLLRRSIALTSGEPEHCRKLIAVLEKKGEMIAAERWRGYLSAVAR